jgi:uncharacterized membrane protein YphA (DoxX/SURF4 family)
VCPAGPLANSKIPCYVKVPRAHPTTRPTPCGTYDDSAVVLTHDLNGYAGRADPRTARSRRTGFGTNPSQSGIDGIRSGRENCRPYLEERIVADLLNSSAHISLLARLLLAVVFLRAGASKVVATARFESAIEQYAVIPQTMVPVTAKLLPVVEILGGVLLAVGVAVRFVAPVVGLLLLAFAGAMASNLVRGRTIDCGCSGTTLRSITWRHVLFNVCLAALSIPVTIQATDAVWSGSAWDSLLPALLTLGALGVAGSLARSGMRLMRAGDR